MNAAIAAPLDQRRAPLAGLEDEYPFASHLLDLDGVALHFVDEGPRDAETLLFVHGNPTWSFYWRHVIRNLSDRYRCIAPDHVGCGLSDKPARYSYRLATHIENLERLVQHLDLARITLVVHDWGGPIGLGFAGRHPERVARLVILNTSAFPGPAPLRIRVCRTPLLGALAVRGLNAFAGLATMMAVTDRTRMTPTVRRGYLAPYSDWASRVATLRFVEDIPLDPSHPSWSSLQEVEAGLARLADKPACLIWGERDWCFTPAYRRGFQQRLPRARVHRAEHAGHYVVEDAREDVLRWIEAFLVDHPLVAVAPDSADAPSYGVASYGVAPDSANAHVEPRRASYGVAPDSANAHVEPRRASPPSGASAESDATPYDDPEESRGTDRS